MTKLLHYHATPVYYRPIILILELQCQKRTYDYCGILICKGLDA